MRALTVNEWQAVAGGEGQGGSFYDSYGGVAVGAARSFVMGLIINYTLRTIDAVLNSTGTEPPAEPEGSNPYQAA